MWLKQSTAATIALGPFVDNTNGYEAETSLTISQADIRLSKNGAAFAQTNNAAGATHMENGYYSVPLDTTDTGTLGRLRVAVAESGALPVWQDFMVLPANVYDSLIAGSDKLAVDTQEWAGAATDSSDVALAATPSNFAALAITAGGAVTAGTVSDKTGYSLANGAITAAVIATDAIDADAIADNAIDAGAIATGAITSAKFAAGAITATVIATDAIDADAIADNAITAASIADDAITATKIADNAIDAGAIAADAITAAKIAAGAITAAKFGAGAIDSTVLADNAITDAKIAADVDTYQAKVGLVDDDTGSADRYEVAWFKNGQPVTSGITVPTIQVYKAADGTDLIATTAMTQIASTGTYRYNEATNRISDGAAYWIKVEATINGSTRSWLQHVGRDS